MLEISSVLFLGSIFGDDLVLILSCHNTTVTLKVTAFEAEVHTCLGITVLVGCEWPKYEFLVSNVHTILSS